MIVEVIGGTIKYIASTGDWLAELVANGASMSITVSSITGSMEMGSGINYDNLSVFIGEIKTDAISRGINWSGN
jgi:hypothetical protein